MTRSTYGLASLGIRAPLAPATCLLAPSTLGLHARSTCICSRCTAFLSGYTNAERLQVSIPRSKDDIGCVPGSRRQPRVEFSARLAHARSTCLVRSSRPGHARKTCHPAQYTAMRCATLDQRHFHSRKQGLTVPAHVVRAWLAFALACRHRLQPSLGQRQCPASAALSADPRSNNDKTSTCPQNQFPNPRSTNVFQRCNDEPPRSENDKSHGNFLTHTNQG